MKAQALMISVFVAVPAYAANFGTSAEPPKTSPAVTTPAPTTPPKPATATPLLSGPQVTGSFRIVKPDGSTVIQQTPVSVGGNAVNVINVAASDAFLMSGGKCAFNVKYDEVAAVAASGTTNRIFDNDALIAQNTKIDLASNVLKTTWTQVYLSPGQNNVRLAINADSNAPSMGMVRINVSGSCAPAPAPAPAPASAPVSTTTKTEAPKPEAPKAPTPPSTTPSAPAPKTEPAKPTTTPAPAPAPTPAPVPKFTPGSAEWNNLNNAFGYSNFAVTQLKGKTYARYSEMVKLNADITVVINAKVVDQPTYNSLMARWNSFAIEPAFQAAMKAVTPSTDKK